MTHCLPRLLLVMLAVLCLAGCGGEEDEDIKSVFDDYVAAIQKRDAAKFMQTIDPQVVERYDEQVKLAQKGSKAQIIRLTPFAMADVLIMRHRLPRETLKTLTGDQWVRMGITEGWFDFDDGEVQEFRLGRITHRTPRASAELIADGEKTGLKVEFVKVEGRWLINEDCFSPWFDKALEQMAARMNKPMIDLLFFLESEESGKRVDPAVFDKPPLL